MSDEPADDDSLLAEQRSANGQPPEARGDASPSLDATKRPKQRRLLRGVVVGILLGIVVGGIGSVVVLAIRNRDALPMMKANDYRAALARWKEHGPKSYDLDMDVGMSLNGRMHLEVRDGAVTKLTLDGKPLQPRLGEYWSINGLFEIIGLDTERNEAAVKNGESLYSLPVAQQAKFDPNNGIPLEYRRREESSGQAGQWKIVSFQPRD